MTELDNYRPPAARPWPPCRCCAHSPKPWAASETTRPPSPPSTSSSSSSAHRPSAPKRGDVTAGGSAGVDAASWGRKLLEASSDADVDVGGEEEQMGDEVTTDGLDEAVRVLLSWKKIKNGIKNAASKAGGVAKKVVQKGGVEALKAAAKGYSNGGMEGALKAGGGSLARTGKTMV
ncbi:unnamed protein product [Closterium sp. Naga37s-1]|nr:unnamed protein product [Closterium sp. Naga37s-1]